jgi:prepilin-type N-terminal cleavage/methylation domain-containing protein
LFRKRLREESGYSLVEVMVSIIILAIAILPMASMFDMGLNSATAGSKYDKARALANLKMEEAKNLSFADVENDFPEAGNPTPYDEPSA